MQEDDDDVNDSPPEAFICPITFNIMEDPVLLAEDGFTYERLAIQEWLEKQVDRGLPMMSPMTGEEVDCLMFPNLAIKGQIQAWRAAHPVKTSTPEEDKDGGKGGEIEEEGAWSEVRKQKDRKPPAAPGLLKKMPPPASPASAYTFPIPCPNKENRITKRMCQLEQIKKLECYILYLLTVPRGMRGPPHACPRTPDPVDYVDASNTVWSSAMNQWRHALIEWRPPGAESDAKDEGGKLVPAPRRREINMEWLQVMLEMGIDEKAAVRAARSPLASSAEEAVGLALSAPETGPETMMRRCFYCRSLLAESSAESHIKGKSHARVLAQFGITGSAALSLGTSADLQRCQRAFLTAPCITCRERQCTCNTTKQCFVCNVMFHVDSVQSHVWGKKHALLCLQQGVPLHLVHTLGDPRWVSSGSLATAAPLDALPNAPRRVPPPANSGPTIPKELRHRCTVCKLDMSVNEKVAHEAGKKHRANLGLM